jgi:hypothetical protein
VLLSRLEVGSAYPSIAGALFVMALGMGSTMAPATEAVMGAIPRSRAGVGSAMNDTTRQLGGALGVAIIGSLLASVYRNEVGAALAGLPASALAAAEDSLGAALHIASTAGPRGEAMAAAAKQAFVDGMSVSFVAAAGVAVAGAVIVLLFLPAYGVEMGDDFAEAEQGGGTS